ncbi:NUMOD4 motif-containing HNH endonuclease [Rhodococcus rhodochrous]|uniref:NUMOD4 motif-containing HNH endonuclease n=1 Tax=Rhodococcus rhodochrous TaxID=1829 RepID=UPI003558780A
MPDSTPIEIWKPIPGFEGYYDVSNQGNVRGLDRIVPAGPRQYRIKGKVLKPRVNVQTSYLSVSLRKNGATHYLHIHTLVLLAFVSPRPDGMEVCHNNGDRSDNRLSNLRYGTPSENGHDAVRHGRNKNERKTHCKRGHPFDLLNTYFQPNRGGRFCRTCREIRRREWRDRNIRKSEA